MIWASILQFLIANGMRIALYSIVAGAIAFGAYRINLSFQQSQQIEALETQAQENIRQVELLKLENIKNMQVLTQRNERDAKALKKVTKQLEAIKHVKPEDDGITRNVLRDSLTFMREADGSTD